MISISPAEITSASTISRQSTRRRCTTGSTSPTNRGAEASVANATDTLLTLMA